MKRTLLLSVCLLAFTCVVWSQTTQNTVTVSKEEFDALKAKVADLEEKLEELLGRQTTPELAEPVEPGEQTGESSDSYAETPQAGATTGPGGRHLQLPDISLIVQARGKATDDKLDPDRQKILLSEAELGIQGYVYPNVKADAFITGSPAEDEPFQVEEAYLTYLGLTKGLNVYVGKKHVPFGRTNLLHNHSWLYARQPTVISSLVAPESLTGQGVDFSYLIPTRNNLFAQLDVGTWANGDEGEQSDLPNIVAGPGANMTDRFSTARLWASYPTSENGELELGGSWADGKSEEDPITLETDHVLLTGVDLSYRHFGEGSSRLLLRGENFWRRGTTDSDGDMATGYYLFGNYRWDKYGSIGLLYDWNEFPQDTSLHESALSLIYTKQFSEQYYLRLQAIHGSRPDADPYNELWLQWVWGVGPHTHNLE
ncbi:MAG: hypothetical protein A2Z18_09835 [Armatimonadetes bacterium RBG_16_58_9]|nr:MAG: hypothetical protein A2Z18_09835 [Armatimonadetes bacterium RBG_16_58_9]